MSDVKSIGEVLREASTAPRCERSGEVSLMWKLNLRQKGGSK